MARAHSFALNIMRKNGVTNVAKALWNGAPSITSWHTKEFSRHYASGLCHDRTVLREIGKLPVCCKTGAPATTRA
jgi:hypothetical protein